MIYPHIVDLLNKHKIPFREISHEASTSCEHSRTLRESVWMEWAWSKNIVFHAKGKFYLVTTLGDNEIKARNFKHEFGTKDIRFASQDEMTKVIWATIGSIPPFGFENSDIPIFVDSNIFTYDSFCFNPWISDKSIQISTGDLQKIYTLLKNPVILFTFQNEMKKFTPLEK